MANAHAAKYSLVLVLGYNDLNDTRECYTSVEIKKSRNPRVKDPITLPDQAVLSGKTYSFDIS